MWANQGLKQQSGGRKEAAGTCSDQHGISSETEGSRCTMTSTSKCHRSNPKTDPNPSNTSSGAAPMGGVLPSRSCWRLCCLIWLREGRGWLAAAMVSFVQSSTSLWRSSVNVPLLLLLLFVCTWASRMSGWGDGEGVAAVSEGGVWLAAVWAVVVLRDDPENAQRS